MSSRSRSRGRPLKGRKKRIRVSFTLSPECVIWLGNTSKESNLSRSELIEAALKQFIPQFQSSPQIGNVARIESRLGYTLPMSNLSDLCKRHGISKLDLFGSILRGDFDAGSDIDLLVEFEPGKIPGLFQMVAIEGELSNLFGGRKVDLKTREELSSYFRSEVLEQAQPIYGG